MVLTKIHIIFVVEVSHDMLHHTDLNNIDISHKRKHIS